MSWTLREEFRTTGLLHLTAGQRGERGAGVRCGVRGCSPCCGRARGPGCCFAALALIGFVILARPSPACWRAAVMGGVALLAILVGRQPLGTARAGRGRARVAADRPGAGAPTPGLRCRCWPPGRWWCWRRPGRPGCGGWACPLGWPRRSRYRRRRTWSPPPVVGWACPARWSLVAVLANLLAAPAVGPVTVLGVMAAVTVPGQLGARPRCCAWLATPAVGWLVWVAHWGAGVPGASLSLALGVGRRGVARPRSGRRGAVAAPSSAPCAPSGGGDRCVVGPGADPVCDSGMAGTGWSAVALRRRPGGCAGAGHRAAGARRAGGQAAPKPERWTAACPGWASPRCPWW